MIVICTDYNGNSINQYFFLFFFCINVSINLITYDQIIIMIAYHNINLYLYRTQQSLWKIKNVAEDITNQMEGEIQIYLEVLMDDIYNRYP